MKVTELEKWQQETKRIRDNALTNLRNGREAVC